MSFVKPMIAVGAALALLTGSEEASAETGDIVEYQSEYEVRYKGRRVARATFSVTAGEDGEHVFQSVTRARGIWRLASPNPAMETSRFSVAGERLVPIQFDYQDGSRKGEDNYMVEFDRPGDQVRIASAGGILELPLEDGLLDRGSLQVALMYDLSACRAPGPYRYVDDDGIRTYEYERVDDLDTETGIGTLSTIRFSQSREGSSRTTNLWLAPDLQYLPVRIEQLRDGSVETVFTLEDVDGIERRNRSCSGFR